MAEDFIKVGTRGDLQAAGGKLKVIVNGKGVAIFEIAGAVHAVQNACPHRGAPLTTGLLQEMAEGAFVICPDHAWRFRVTDGICPEAGPECTLMIWDVKFEGDDLFLSRLPRLA